MVTSHDTERTSGRGFTLIELTIGCVLLVSIAATLRSTLLTAVESTAAARSDMGNTETVRAILTRIAYELRSSSRRGEARNENGELDEGEDLNGNERLDSDWLATDTSIRFNRMLTDGTFTPPLTYRWTGDRIVSEHMLTSGRVIRTPVASGITGFNIAQIDDSIRIRITRKSLGRSETQSMVIAPRN